MSAWTTDELSNIGAAHELELTTLRRDASLRKPVTVWVVRVDDDHAEARNTRASERSSSRIVSLPARSAIVRATRRTRCTPLDESTRADIASFTSESPSVVSSPLVNQL